MLFVLVAEAEVACSGGVFIGGRGWLQGWRCFEAAMVFVFVAETEVGHVSAILFVLVAVGRGTWLAVLIFSLVAVLAGV